MEIEGLHRGKMGEEKGYAMEVSDRQMVMKLGDGLRRM